MPPIMWNILFHDLLELTSLLDHLHCLRSLAYESVLLEDVKILDRELSG